MASEHGAGVENQASLTLMLWVVFFYLSMRPLLLPTSSSVCRKLLNWPHTWIFNVVTLLIEAFIKMRFSLFFAHRPCSLTKCLFNTGHGGYLFWQSPHLLAQLGPPMWQVVESRAASAHSWKQRAQQDDGPMSGQSSDMRAEPRCRKDAGTNAGYQLAFKISAVFSRPGSRHVQLNKR